MSEPYYGWAIDAVETLRWLLHLDDWAFAGVGANLGRHDPRVVDVGHARWATTTAVTALDLCAAEIAVRYGSKPFWSERMPTLTTVRDCLDEVHPGVTAWLNRVESDPDYHSLRGRARDSLGHRFLVRTALIGPGRTSFELDRSAPPEDRLDAREIILMSLDLADRHVSDFGRTLGSTSAPPPPRPA